MVEDNGLPGYRGRLNDQCVTIAQVLQPAGYFTAMSGKWHVGQKHGVVPVEPRLRRQPQRRRPAGSTTPTTPRASSVPQRPKARPTTARELPKGWYTTDLWTDYGIKFIDEALAAKKPFFLYLPTTPRTSR